MKTKKQNKAKHSIVFYNFFPISSSHDDSFNVAGEYIWACIMATRICWTWCTMSSLKSDSVYGLNAHKFDFRYSY